MEAIDAMEVDFEAWPFSTELSRLGTNPLLTGNHDGGFPDGLVRSSAIGSLIDADDQGSAPSQEASDFRWLAELCHSSGQGDLGCALDESGAKIDLRLACDDHWHRLTKAGQHPGEFALAMFAVGSFRRYFSQSPHWQGKDYEWPVGFGP